MQPATNGVKAMGARQSTRLTAACLAAALLLLAAAVPSPSARASAATLPRVTVQPLCGPAQPGYAQCYALRRTDIAPLADLASRQGAASPATPFGFGPADLAGAYSLPGGNAGAGMTVAIVDAYDLPTAESQLGTYRTTFGLGACTTANGCFRKVDQNGGTNYPTADGDWGGEIALDIDMVSATCPACKILLVEANSNSDADLGAAVNRAATMGAVAVSNSWGGPEDSSVHVIDGLYFNHPGVAITASTGDCGYSCSSGYDGASYPASSPYVVAIGGTSLVRDGSSRGWSESAWGSAGIQWGAGSGCSAYEARPSWQAGVTDASCAKRMEADVSAVADPATGVAVYYAGDGGWTVYGGTSASSPIIAAIFAMARRPAANAYPARYLYANSTYLNDAVGGSNDIGGDCAVTYFCTGVAGYDGPTGLGTPIGVTAFGPAKPGKPRTVSATLNGSDALVTWTAPASDGGSSIGGYTVSSSPAGVGCTTTGALSCTASSLAPGVGYTFTVAATNNVGTGPASDPSNQVTVSATPTPPGKAANVVANPRDGSALVSWQAPGSAGSSQITLYTVTSDPDGKHCTWTTGPLTCTVNGLVNGRSYSFTVVATNDVGDGAVSDPSNSVVPGSTDVPDAPSNVHATAADSSAIVSWSAAADNGSAISGYTATAQPGGRSCLWSSGPLTCAIARLTNHATYSITVTAANDAGTGPASSPAVSVIPNGPGTTYHAINPARVLDTRATSGSITNIGLTGQFSVGAIRSFKVAGARYVGGGTPAAIPSNAVAVTGNLTVTRQTAPGYVALGPTSASLAGTSTLDFYMSENRANNVTMGLSTDGKLSAVLRSSMPAVRADLIFDVTGYFTADGTGATYTALAPGRVLDTRPGSGHIGLAGKFASKTVRTVSVAGVKALGWSSALVPANAAAITANLTIANATSSGFLSVGPTITSSPKTSNVNVRKGMNTANGVAVALKSGAIQAVWVGAPGSSADLVIDVTGYFRAGLAGLQFYPIAPYRLLDSTLNKGLAGPFGTGSPRTLGVSGTGGTSGVPSGATGIAGSLTLVSPTSGGYAFAAPLIGGTPTSSTVNAPARMRIANGFDVALDAFGRLMLIWVGSGGSTAHLQLDIDGYWK